VQIHVYDHNEKLSFLLCNSSLDTAENKNKTLPAFIYHINVPS